MMPKRIACASLTSLVLLTALPAQGKARMTVLTCDPVSLGVRVAGGVLRIGDGPERVLRLLGKPTKTNTHPYRESYYDALGVRVRGQVPGGRVETIAFKARERGDSPMFFFLAGLHWRRADFVTDTGLGPDATLAQVKARYGKGHLSVQAVGNMTILEANGPRHQHVEFVFRDDVFQELRLRRV